MKRLLLILVSMATLLSCSDQESMEELTQRVMDTAEQQYEFLYSQLDGVAVPQTVNVDGTLKTTSIYSWISGFFPGTAWYIYEYTYSEQMKKIAEEYTLRLDSVKYVTDNHDVGFMLYCSYGNALRLTGDEKYREPLYTGARSLATRFNPNTGVIQSWNKMGNWIYPVIIDNMMNLELLMFVSKQTGDTSLSDIALSHADTTIKNHFREDYSTFHVVDYDPETGAVRARQTKQGFADDSSWARGQSWALYGYTMMYRETGNEKYREQAEHVADMLIGRLPADGIPYWDYDSTAIPDDYRDSSAAAIMASGLIELSQYVADKEQATHYLATAEKQLRTLASPEYLAETGTECGFLLKHGVGNKPSGSEIDVPLTYGDYYFLEALLRLKAIGEE